MTNVSLPELAAWAAGGALLAALYLHLLRRTVDALVAGGRMAAGWLVLRVALAVAFFWGAAQGGGGPLLAAAAGFALARLVLVRLARRA